MKHKPDIEYYYLETVRYETAHRLQRELWELRRENAICDQFILLHHPPVITLGRSSEAKHLLASPEELDRRGVSVVEVERGGDITLHSPNQLTGYFIFDLKARGLSVRQFVSKIEQVVIEAAAEFHIEAGRNEGFPGVWVEDRKLSSLGVSLKRGVSMHGFSLNVRRDLLFRYIVPCGITGVWMTSLHEESDLMIDEMRLRSVTLDGVSRAFFSKLELSRVVPELFEKL